MKLREYYLGYRSAHAEAVDYSDGELVRIQKGARLIEGFTGRWAAPLLLLDVGCGAGTLHRFLTQERYTLIGTELNPQLCHEAARHYRRVIQLDLEERWPIKDGTIHVVFAAALLEHIFDYHDLLNECNRVLRPGGLLVVEVPNLGYWKEVRKLFVRKHPHWANDMQHLHMWTQGKLIQVLTWHGFRVLHCECDSLNLPFPKHSAFLERRFASWGRNLIVGAIRERRARVVDARMPALSAPLRHLDRRTVEVADDGGRPPD
jgi:2-polyprenyl-6-hydroxyphenyl methylase/3-demethylubiquinone-9 3-methyltransferase